MATPRILFMGQDLYALGYVSTIPALNESKGFERGKISPSDFTFEVVNIDDQFSIDNPKSFLNNTNWQFSSVKFYDDSGELRFDGIAANIKRNHVSKMATIECKDILFQSRKTGINNYVSAGWETPAAAAKNILDAEGFTNYDVSSFIKSDNNLISNSCYVKVAIKQEDNVTLVGIIQTLGKYAAADVYMKRNKIYFEHWVSYSGGAAISFDYSNSDLTPLTAPNIETLEKSFYNDYLIGYYGDAEIPAADEDNNDLGLASRGVFGTQKIELTGSGNNQVIFKDKTSAVYIGETYIKRGHYALNPVAKVLQQISFDLQYDFKNDIELGTIFKMTFAEEGWTAKLFEVIDFTRDFDAQKISIKAWEMVSG